ncbi:MAG TPA: zf-HC2 domain-containing protein [Pyrinomonadaceae bacterium]|jgi:predicted anti-sigma-YlaC factor YlaD
MDCTESLVLLSDYRDGLLNEAVRALISKHLEECPPCNGLYLDIDIIVTSAPGMRADDGINYPDENIIWQRVRVATNPGQS